MYTFNGIIKTCLMEKEWLYRLALTRVKGVGRVRAKILFNKFGEAAAIFRENAGKLAKIKGVGTTAAAAIAGFKDFPAIEQEVAFMEQYRIRPLFFTDKDYPQRLAIYKEAPALLFYMGNADLNAPRVLAIVGTRTPTEYGKQLVEKFIPEIKVPDLLIVSGLAYGIDALAHKAAVKNNLPTIGVLGHGLDRMYPEQNRRLAGEMTKHGGLLTEFPIGTRPDEHNFPLRNRIVAGMCDALIVVETDTRGGSLLTVENALKCKKKIFAFPGRVSDVKSSGCNALIQNGKARLLTSPRHFLENMHWRTQIAKSTAGQAALFPASGPALQDHPALPDLPDEEKKLLHMLTENEVMSLDDFLATGNMDRGQLAISLLNLEIQGLIRSLPGRRYKMTI